MLLARSAPPAHRRGPLGRGGRVADRSRSSACRSSGVATLAAVNAAGAAAADGARPARAARPGLGSRVSRGGLPRPARELIGRLSYSRAVALGLRPAGRGAGPRPSPGRGARRRQAVEHPADGRRRADALRLQPRRRSLGRGRGGRPAAGRSPTCRPSGFEGPGRRAAEAGGAVDLHRADLYALGLVLVETLTGIAPAVPAAGTGTKGPRLGPGRGARRRGHGLPGLEGPADTRRDCGRSWRNAWRPTRRERYAEGVGPRRGPRPLADRPRAGRRPRWPWPERAARWGRRRRLPIAAVAADARRRRRGVGRGRRDVPEHAPRQWRREKYDRFVDKDDLGLFGFQPFRLVEPPRRRSGGRGRAQAQPVQRDRGRRLAPPRRRRDPRRVRPC